MRLNSTSDPLGIDPLWIELNKLAEPYELIIHPEDLHNKATVGLKIVKEEGMYGDYDRLDSLLDHDKVRESIKSIKARVEESPEKYFHEKLTDERKAEIISRIRKGLPGIEP